MSAQVTELGSRKDSEKLNPNPTLGRFCRCPFTISVFLLFVFLPGLFYRWIPATTRGYSAGLDFKKRNGKERYYSAEILSPAKHKRCTGCCSRGMQHLLTLIATLSLREGLAFSDLSSSLKFSILFYLASSWH